MVLDYRFRKFLSEIRPTPLQQRAFRHAHLTLRSQLGADAALERHLVATFLQGSYRRSTAVRPLGATAGSDVDLVVVTDFDFRRTRPAAAMRLLQRILERHGYRWRQQGRSFGIEVDGVSLDLVLASAPSKLRAILRGESAAEPLEDDLPVTEAETDPWKREPLMIPDSEARCWRASHPLAQLAQTREKNQLTRGHYVNVVKAIKCWKHLRPGLPEHPKGYPLERLIEACCPDDIASVAEGVTRTLEAIATRYSRGRKPRLPSGGLSSGDVLERVPADDFAAFVREAGGAAKIARQALEGGDSEASLALWPRLFGPAFPAGPLPVEEVMGNPRPTSRSMLATLRERGQLVARGLDEILELKKLIDDAVQRLGVYIEWDPRSPRELADYIGVAALTAVRWGLAGAALGLVIGAIADEPAKWMKRGAGIGALAGALRGVHQVKEGWRLRCWYDQGVEVVEVRVLPPADR